MSELGLTYRGKHSSHIPGLQIAKVLRPLMQQPKEVLEEVPGRDGSYDFSAANSILRQTYPDKIIEVDCNLVEPTDNLQLFRQSIRKVAAWLDPADGKGWLEFDDDPGVYYFGKINNLVSIEQFAASGSFPLTFRCDPFAYGEELSVVKEMTAGNNSMIINNTGSIESPIIISITGHQVDALKTVDPLLTIGSLSIKLTGTLNEGETVVIDTDKYSAGVGSANVLNSISGSFMKLQPGENTVSYSDMGCNAALVAISYRPRWL